MATSFTYISHHHQVVDLLLGQFADFATRQVFLGEACKHATVKLVYFVAKMFEYATYNAVPA